MGVDRGRQRAHAPGRPLRQEQVPAGLVDVGHGGVAQGVEAVQAAEPGLCWPGPKSGPDAELADADAGLGAEEGIAGLQALAACRLVGPGLPEFTDQCLQQENVGGAATLAIFMQIRRRLRGLLSAA